MQSEVFKLLCSRAREAQGQRRRQRIRQTFGGDSTCYIDLNGETVDLAARYSKIREASYFTMFNKIQQFLYEALDPDRRQYFKGRSQHTFQSMDNDIVVIDSKKSTGMPEKLYRIKLWVARYSKINLDLLSFLKIQDNNRYNIYIQFSIQYQDCGVKNVKNLVFSRKYLNSF